jgi:hypothetical protein
VKLEEEREREFELKKGWFKVFQVSGVSNRAEGVRASFYSPQKESSYWGAGT